MSDNCKDCIFAYCALSDDNGDVAFVENDFEDWFCAHPSFGTEQPILEYVSKMYEPSITPPDWCPKIKKHEKMRRTYYERKQILQDYDRGLSWDDITVGKIYHLPPVANEKRCDLLVISKSNYSITCKELDIKNPTRTVVRTFYKSVDLCYKFFTEHKLYDFESLFDLKELMSKPYNNTYYPSI